MAAVCHVTNMTRRHGNIKRECYKITVALKKTITKHGYICDTDLKSCQASASRDTIAEWISFLFTDCKVALLYLSIFEISLYFRYNLLL